MLTPARVRSRRGAQTHQQQQQQQQQRQAAGPARPPQQQQQQHQVQQQQQQQQVLYQSNGAAPQQMRPNGVPPVIQGAYRGGPGPRWDVAAEAVRVGGDEQTVGRVEWGRRGGASGHDDGAAQSLQDNTIHTFQLPFLSSLAKTTTFHPISTTRSSIRDPFHLPCHIGYDYAITQPSSSSSRLPEHRHVSPVPFCVFLSAPDRLADRGRHPLSPTHYFTFTRALP
ncbi:hypothetical protein MSAN_01559800 [Mycena sanguinolenta]|uniref:Uncharacterized protein n=1 Tax=Mycena sanguinolenta TaxID=230812 RepID=A0A8H7CXS3_9AGAR|nr:hypothetical protein MSAN_01559800 [Mycena sanguinolenta]